jgi:hypothetical protein
MSPDRLLVTGEDAATATEHPHLGTRAVWAESGWRHAGGEHDTSALDVNAHVGHAENQLTAPTTSVAIIPSAGRHSACIESEHCYPLAALSYLQMRPIRGPIVARFDAEARACLELDNTSACTVVFHPSKAPELAGGGARRGSPPTNACLKGKISR